RLRRNGLANLETDRVKALGQANRLLGEARGLLVRQRIRVSNTPVHRAQAGASGKAEPCRLYRRGLQREEAQTVARAVPAEIDQDVDLVGLDKRGGRLVRHPRDRAPRIAR